MAYELLYRANSEGIGLVALGVLLKQFSKQGNNAFENLGDGGNPEQAAEVLPLERIPYLIERINGGTNGNGILEVRIHGDELVAMYDRRKKHRT